ncbi:MAG: sigma-54-dependent Fis family transcriptional regulator, partial [Candidatus Krumholzibacteriota bacterium]|nr:sigma-54-dependent Fis family transcriptional regulator [Candidatus Krumholzibacteriota bacterium]
FVKEEKVLTEGRSGSGPRYPRALFAASRLEGDNWRLGVGAGGREWQYSTVWEGLLVKLSLEPWRDEDGFSPRRLESLFQFVDLLEPLIAGSPIDAWPFDLVPEAGDQGYPAFPPAVTSFDPPLLGLSREMVLLKRDIRKIAPSGLSVLIEGESGTGKEIVARNIHNLSGRRREPLVIANCMEMPASLLQSELFGHAKGSFTGALKDRRGLIENSAGGTFFLDEIGEMPLSLQASLLRVLQEREIRRVGESVRRSVDVRFIFATNRNLSTLVKEQKFREDLYFRINGIRLYVTALRRRRKDILPLAEYFLRGAAREAEMKVPALTGGTARRLLTYPWPGNVRELKNEMYRMVALNRGTRVIAPEMLLPHIGDPPPARGGGRDENDGSLTAAVQRLERKLIAETLERFAGNRTKTAAALGITRQGLLNKLKRYGCESLNRE